MQTEAELQVRQWWEQAAQDPLETKKVTAQLVQAEAEVQARQLLEQAVHAVPLSKKPWWHLQVIPSNICPVFGQLVGAMQLALLVPMVK